MECSSAHFDISVLNLPGLEVIESAQYEQDIFNKKIQEFDSLVNNETNNFSGNEEFEKCSKVTEIDDIIIGNAEESIRVGDLTPIELLIQKQTQLEDKKTENLKNKTYKRLSAEESELDEAGKRRKVKHTRQQTKSKKNLIEEFSDSSNICYPSTSNPQSDLEDGEIVSPNGSDNDDYLPNKDDSSAESSFSQDECQSSSLEEEIVEQVVKSRKKSSRLSSLKGLQKEKVLSLKKDDGDLKHFESRIRRYRAEQELNRLNGEVFDDPDSFQELKNAYKVSSYVWDKLYRYQKTGIRWMHELHSQLVGGILADEMGLGKTIQICVFLRSLAESQQESRIFDFKGLGPTLVICPATVMHQWVRELNLWFPLCRTAVLHSSGSYGGSKKSLIYSLGKYRSDGSVLITSYQTFTNEHKAFQKVNWSYVILDEGHKIRNPETKMTLRIKELKTPHRLILSGSPMQNNLKELWSLIDFIYPGRLGSLTEFTEKFSIPITQGGYANATAIQVRTAYKCACLLRDAISPYMLRRMKKDVQMVLQLPEKTEQIYLEFLRSKDCHMILEGKAVPFYGLVYLRKICNHADLVVKDSLPNAEYGAIERSGKMIVVHAILKLWFGQGHRVLLFSQSRQMLSILERVIVEEGYNYLRMDGATPIKKRQDLIERFNTNKDIFLFLLTTRVGGLGVNLTGANRVVIFDPDWNPSTDVQARERAWRIGQSRMVTVYRLLTSGTIEEKIYQRQIFKHFLANRILVDPKQQRFFKTNDLHELFTLGSEKNQGGSTETASIFSGVADELTRKNIGKNKGGDTKKEKGKEFNSIVSGDQRNEVSCTKGDSATVGTSLSPKTTERLQKIAKKLAGNFSNMYDTAKDGIKIKKCTLLDGKYEIPNLRKQKKANHQREQNSETKEDNKKQDDFVLRQLLEKSRIRSALQHDQIVGDGTRATADYQLVEDEAEAVAKRAAEVVKRSRRLHDNFLAFTAAPSKKPLFGCKRAVEYSNHILSQTEEERVQEEVDESFEASANRLGSFQPLSEKNSGSGAELLRAIHQRKEAMLENIESEDDGEMSDEEIQSYPSLVARLKPERFRKNDRFETLAEELRRFLGRNGGSVSTADLLTEFKNRVSPADSFAFRSILKKLCKQCPNSQWILKPEFC